VYIVCVCTLVSPLFMCRCVLACTVLLIKILFKRINVHNKNIFILAVLVELSLSLGLVSAIVLLSTFDNGMFGDQGKLSILFFYKP